MKIIRVSVDLAKDVFQVHGVDRNEKPVWKCKLKRSEWIKVLLEKIEPGCEIGMEACGGAHHWARKLEALGYTVKLIAPQFVKPYVKSNKNDRNDAEAICEAVCSAAIPFQCGLRPPVRWDPGTDARLAGCLCRPAGTDPGVLRS